MTKSDFVDQLAQKTDLSKKEAQQVLDTTLDLVTEQVKKNDKVTLTGFGTFEAHEQKATERMNPQSGKKMKVPAKTVPKFRPGKEFKEAVGGK